MKKLMIALMIVSIAQACNSMSPKARNEKLQKQGVQGEKIQDLNTFVQLVQSQNKQAEEMPETPLSPSSIARHEGFRLLRMKHHFMDLIVAAAKTGQVLDSSLFNSEKIELKAGTYLKMPKPDFEKLISQLIELEKEILSRNNVTMLNTTYFQMMKETAIEGSWRRKSAELNKELTSKIQAMAEEGQKLTSDHQQCLKEKSNLEEQVERLQMQIKNQSMVFTKKTIAAGITGAIIATCGFAAYLKWWQRKPAL